MKTRRCEDEKNVLQTPTIGRTLRSDALGKNCEDKHYSSLAMAMQASSMASSPWPPFSHIGTLAGILKHCKTFANSMLHVLVA